MRRVCCGQHAGSHQLQVWQGITNQLTDSCQTCFTAAAGLATTSQLGGAVMRTSTSAHVVPACGQGQGSRQAATPLPRPGGTRGAASRSGSAASSTLRSTGCLTLTFVLTPPLAPDWLRGALHSRQLVGGRDGQGMLFIVPIMSLRHGACPCAFNVPLQQCAPHHRLNLGCCAAQPAHSSGSAGVLPLVPLLLFAVPLQSCCCCFFVCLHSCRRLLCILLSGAVGVLILGCWAGIQHHVCCANVLRCAASSGKSLQGSGMTPCVRACVVPLQPCCVQRPEGASCWEHCCCHFCCASAGLACLLCFLLLLPPHVACRMSHHQLPLLKPGGVSVWGRVSPGRGRVGETCGLTGGTHTGWCGTQTATPAGV